MTLQQLIYFREVAEQRHFTRAADNLFVAQSSLSHSVRMLEEELGVALFSRQSGKRVELTDFGQALLPHVDRIMGELESAKQEIEQMRNPAGGIVNVVYSYFNGNSLIPPVIRAFNESPCSEDIEIHVEINHGPRYFEQEMEVGKIDLTFSAGATIDGLESVPIAYQKLYVMTSAASELAYKETVTLEELENVPMLMYLQGRHLHHWVEKMFAYSGLSPSFHEFYNDWSEVIAAISLGQGCMITPKLPVDSDLVKLIQLDHPYNTRCVYMHWQKDVKLPQAVETFRNFCIEYFQNQNEGKPIVPLEIPGV